MKKILKIVPFLVIAILVGVTAAYADSLTPPGASVQNHEYHFRSLSISKLRANNPSIWNYTTPVSVTPTMDTMRRVYDLFPLKSVIYLMTK